MSTAPTTEPLGCGMPSAIPQLTGATLGVLLGVTANWLLWRWLTRPFRT